MDNNTSLALNMDGTLYVEGKPPMPTFNTVEIVGQSQPTAITQEQILAKRAERTAKQGQAAWGYLHGYKGCDPQWLEIWQFLIPQRCECKGGYQQIIAEMPPDFTSPEAFFAWGVNLHNAVNRKLGKPELTIDEALLIWRKNDADTQDSSEIVP